VEECDYCGATVEDEPAYLDHLAAELEAEMSAIDRRRVEGRDAPDGGVPTGPVALGGVLVVAALVVVYVTFFFGSGGSAGAATVGDPGTAHEHGTINVTVDGETVDFSQPEYQVGQTGNRRFHFEGGTAVWHKHATGVTVQYALDTVDIGVTADSVTVDGTTYRADDPGTEVVVEVNGQPVDPSEYVLRGVESAADARQGDHIRVVVRTGG